jgi:ParB-like chromosome segregation protein Spo0J
MKYNEIGKTGMVVSSLSFGASSLGSVFRSTKESEALEAVYADLAEQMKSALGTKVSISAKNAQKGKIEIEYYSADELDRLCTLLNSIENREGV